MNERRLISVTGLGYVGLTIAAAFAHQYGRVIGFDISTKRINELKKGIDRNGEMSEDEMAKTKIQYTTNPEDLKKANFHIVAVPTPLDKDKQPDLSILLAASETIGKYLKKGDVVVYESSVFPGATEEQCIPVLERASGLVCGKDFGVGYSPERVNPGDKVHTLTNIPKIISAIDEPTLDIIAEVYQGIVKAGVFRVSNMRVAEAAKVMENIQRDVNISFTNEMALILHRLGMDSKEVLDAMRTKWNSLPFQPGMVGGHCIAVNSYYVAQKAEEAGYYPDVIITSRRVNEYMPRFIAESAVKELIHLNKPVKNARVAVLGLTYKEDTPDVHDTKTIDLIKELKAFEMDVLVHDPLADPVLTKNEFGIELVAWENIGKVDAIILTLGHKKYLQLDPEELKAMLNRPGLIMDIKGILKQKSFTDKEITLWRL